jgi:hypothetical protein
VSNYQDDFEETCTDCGRSVSTLFARNHLVTMVPRPDGTLGLVCDACYDASKALPAITRYLQQKEHRAARERARRAAADSIERQSFDLSDLRYGYGDDQG